jgi:hypothetical protein
MSSKLKADLHTHTAEDAKDIIDYSAYQLIDRAAELNFDVLAVTNHDTITFDRELAAYAEKRNILLIPGVEATLSKKHVVILNPIFSNSSLPCSLSDLPRIKSEKSLILAPHPYFPQPCSLGSDFRRQLSCFDAVEYSHFYHARINYNKKAVSAARNAGLPLIGTSDCHFIWEFGSTFSLIEADKSVSAVLSSVKFGKTQIVTRSLSAYSIGRSLLGVAKMRSRMSFRALVHSISCKE